MFLNPQHLYFDSLLSIQQTSLSQVRLFATTKRISPLGWSEAELSHVLSRSDKTQFWARHAYLAKSRDKGFGLVADRSELGLLFVMTKHISPFGGSEASSAPFWILIVLNLNPSCVLQRRSVQKGHNSNRKHLSR